MNYAEIVAFLARNQGDLSFRNTSQGLRVDVVVGEHSVQRWITSQEISAARFDLIEFNVGEMCDKIIKHGVAV